jgi:hypothetical protein
VKHIVWPLVRKPSFPALARRLRTFDVVVVVSTIPGAFLRSFFADDVVRGLLRDVPLVLYDVFYLPTRGMWNQWLRDGNPALGIPEGGQWGLDRYDWYLCASVVSEHPPSPERHPYSLIGLNFDDGSLYPEQDGIVAALIDFESPDDMHERAVQVLALERTGTPYLVLNGQYPADHIRRLYRRTAIYFVAKRESFGLPICELQACGNYIFTPYSNWCPSHWKKPSLAEPGEGRLSTNFVVYHNDLDTLVSAIQQVRRGFDPYHVRETFLREDPTFYWGDVDAVREFLERIRSGEIHARLHRRHRDIALAPLPAEWPAPRPVRHYGMLDGDSAARLGPPPRSSALADME